MEEQLMLNKNLLLKFDGYKYSHFIQYPPGTDYMFDYIESRGGEFDYTLFFGLQYIIKEYLTTPITLEDVEQGREFCAAYGTPYPYDELKYVVEKLGGMIPIRIRAVPEGTIVPNHHVLMTVESTDKNVFWLVSNFETLLLKVWYPITVATQSHYIKQIIKKYLDETSDDTASEIDFKLHDFGYRGVSSEESAAIGGAAHLVNFKGSDTVAGIIMANEFYNSPMSAFSIPASEHSTITSWGRDNEADAYRNMLKHFAKPGSIVACVSDSYDLANAVEHLWGEELRQEVIDSGATVVIRPDSGDPASMVLMTLNLLNKKFGSKLNSKGYMVLNNVRVIQGDGINKDSIKEILNLAKENGYSATNINFGMGGALLQKDIHRDTQKFAMKCSAIRVNGEFREVYKDPITDPGKRSKRGFVDLFKNIGGDFITLDQLDYAENNLLSELVTVYENGKLLVEYSLDEIRDRVNAS